MSLVSNYQTEEDKKNSAKDPKSDSGRGLVEGYSSPSQSPIAMEEDKKEQPPPQDEGQQEQAASPTTEGSATLTTQPSKDTVESTPTVQPEQQPTPMEADEEKQGPKETEDDYLAKLEDLGSAFPPSTAEPCSDELQQKIEKLLERSETPATHIRHKKNYSNPELLSYVVKKFNIEETGSSFDKAVWNPKGLREEDYIEALAAPKPPPKTPLAKEGEPSVAPSPTTSTPTSTQKPKESTIITRKSGGTGKPAGAAAGVVPTVLPSGGSLSLANFAAAIAMNSYSSGSKPN